MELIEKRLLSKLGTYKTEDNVMVGVQLTEPFSDTVEKDLSVIRTLSRPKQDEYDMNDLDYPVMSLIAPESRIQY